MKKSVSEKNIRFVNKFSQVCLLECVRSQVSKIRKKAYFVTQFGARLVAKKRFFTPFDTCMLHSDKIRYISTLH